jgi:hypothetical protein
LLELSSAASSLDNIRSFPNGLLDPYSLFKQRELRPQVLPLPLQVRVAQSRYHCPAPDGLTFFDVDPINEPCDFCSHGHTL